MGIIVIPLLLVVTFFVPRTLGKMFALNTTLPLYIFFGIMTALIPLSFYLFFTQQTKFADLLFLASSTWLGVLFYLFILLTIYQLTKLIIPLPPFKSGVYVLSITAVIMIYSTINAYTLKTVEVDIPVHGLKKDVKIALASDVHINSHRNKSYLVKMVNTINDFKPDFTVFAGDMVDSNTALEEDTFGIFKGLNTPSYFVLGNHDLYVDTERLIELIKSSGITFLQNDVVDRDGIQLIGLDYMDADEDQTGPHRATSTHTIKETLPTLSLQKDIPSVLITHKPDGMQYMPENGIDVVLSGHTHGGGQIFPITLISRYMNLNEYISGLYKIGESTTLYVSEGIGTFALPMRLGTNNELTFITLSPAE